MEKFDPSDPKYKKVEDLPEDKRKDFSDVEGGFVKKEVIDYHRKIEEKQKGNESIGDKLRNALEKVLEGEENTRKGKVLEMIMQQAVLHNNPQEIEKMDDEEKETVILGLIDEYCENLDVKVRAKYLGPMQEGLQKAGRSGELFIEECQNDCTRLYGSIDGNSINVHSRDDDTGTAKELFKAYGNIAVDARGYRLELHTIEQTKELLLDILKGEHRSLSSAAPESIERERANLHDIDYRATYTSLAGNVEHIAEHFKLTDKETEELWPILVTVWNKKNQGWKEKKKAEEREEEREEIIDRRLEYNRKRRELERLLPKNK